MVLLEANLDDVTGEILGATVAALDATAGALDAWVTPVTGKKGRPAFHVVSVLGRPGRGLPVAPGPRRRDGHARDPGPDPGGKRWPAERQFAEVDVSGYPVRVKRGPRRIKAEHDDAARVGGLLPPTGPGGGPASRGGSFHRSSRTTGCMMTAGRRRA